MYLENEELASYISFHEHPKVHYVSGGCGSGKTFAICQEINATGDRNWLYVAPTIELLRQTNKMLEAEGVSATIITSESAHRDTKRCIIEHLKRAEEEGEVLLITWNAYGGLRYLPRRSNWRVVIDEIPQLDTFYALVVPRHYARLSQELEVSPLDGTSLGRVRLKSEHRTKKWIDGHRDDLDEPLRPLFSDLLLGNKEVFVDLNSWERICDRGEIGKTDESNTVYFISLLNANLFDRTTLVGANVKDSMLAAWLAQKECRFYKHPSIATRLRQLPDYSTRAKITYFLEHTNSSKFKYAKMGKSGRAIIDEMDQKALEIFGGAPFLYVANNDRQSGPIDAARNAVRIPVLSHGRNDWQHYHNIYFSPALNRQPKHYAMLDELGLDRDLVFRATACEVAYQCALRTSLRNPESKEPVHIIVADKVTAEHIGKILNCTHLNQVGDWEEFPRTRPLTGRERARRVESRRRMEQLFSAKPIHSTSLKEGRIDSEEQKEIQGGNSFPCSVTFHRKPEDRIASSFHPVECDVQELIQLLRSKAAVLWDRKEDRHMFNAGIYEPSSASQGYRRFENFVRSSFIILDFDNGRLSPEDFVNIFSGRSDKVRCSFVIFNTFSRSPLQPNRFRVVLFYNNPARSPEEHRAVYDWVEAMLRINGFPDSGLDPICKAANQSYYMPCSNRAFPGWAFFEAHNTRTKELPLYGIDPGICFEFFGTSRSAPNLHTGEQSSSPSPERIAEIMRPLQGLTEGRHRPMFIAGCRLAALGLTRHEVEAELMQFAGQERHLRRKVKPILDSLDTYRRGAAERGRASG